MDDQNLHPVVLTPADQRALWEYVYTLRDVMGLLISQDYLLNHHNPTFRTCPQAEDVKARVLASVPEMARRVAEADRMLTVRSLGSEGLARVADYIAPAPAEHVN